MKAAYVETPGGPENLKYGDVPRPVPGPGQALVKIAASGVNFVDIYYRSGLYPTQDRPMLIGAEGAGTVEAVGPDVTDVKLGERVAYAMPRGSYAEYAVAPSWQLCKLPDKVDFQTAAAAMLQGMTAHYLTHSTYPLKKGDRCLVHAAAGGVGLLLIQMAKMLGAHVTGTVGSEEKVPLAKQAGADEVIVYTKESFVPKAKDMHVVYDSVGKATFHDSLKCLRVRGMMVSYGNASGAVPDFPMLALAPNAIFLTRPGLPWYTLTREELEWRANDVLNWITDGKLKLRIYKTYPLAEAAQAQRDLESRTTTGKLILLP